MTLILILKELRRRWILVAASVIVAAMVALFAIYQVGFSPPSVSKRAATQARGSVEMLIDSPRSAIADVARDIEPLTTRAGIFARFIAGGDVVRRISKQTGIPSKRIEVSSPLPLPGEVAGGEAPAPALLPYGIEIIQRDQLPIVDVDTRAPTVKDARALAAAAPVAIRQIVSSIQRQQGIPEGKRVTFRALGPAQADVVTDAKGAKIALVIFCFVLLILLLLILGVPRFREAWRNVETETSPWDPNDPQSQLPVIVGVRASPAADPQGVRALAAASIAAAEEIVDRAQLEAPEEGASNGHTPNGDREQAGTQAADPAEPAAAAEPAFSAEPAPAEHTYPAEPTPPAEPAYSSEPSSSAQVPPAAQGGWVGGIADRIKGARGEDG